MMKIGKRICIVGATAGGKSTLAEKLAAKTGLPLLHLDQIFHIPHTQWEPRPYEEFEKEHDVFMAKEAWIIEGTYSKLLPKRLEKADTVILCQQPRWKLLYNFLKRRYGKQHHAGCVVGAKEEISFNMLRHIWNYPARYQKLRLMLAKHPHLNVIYLNSFKEADMFLAGIKG